MAIWTKPIIVIISLFTLFKIFFGILGWYSRTGKDEIYRRNLEDLWNVLDKETLFEVVHRILSRFINRVDALSENRLRVLAIIILLSLVVNSFIIYLAFINFTEVEKDIIFDARYTVSRMIVTTFILGIFIDLISLFITIKLVRIASNALSLLNATLHIIIDCIIAYISIYFLLIPLTLVVFSPIGNWTSFNEFLKYLFFNYWISIEHIKNLIFFVSDANFISISGSQAIALTYFCLGISSALPSAIYLSILTFIVTLKFVPKFVKPKIMGIIYLVTTDEKPVLSQLGTAFGLFGATIGAILVMIK